MYLGTVSEARAVRCAGGAVLLLFLSEVLRVPCTERWAILRVSERMSEADVGECHASVTDVYIG